MTLDTKAEAEAVFAGLQVVAVVTDEIGDGHFGIKDALRRRYVLGQTLVEIGASPSPEHLSDLARHVPDAKRAAARAAFGLPPEVKPTEEEPVGVSK